MQDMQLAQNNMTDWKKKKKTHTNERMNKWMNERMGQK